MLLFLKKKSLFKAIKEDNIEKLKQLLSQEGISIEIKDKEQQDLLSIAYDNNSHEIITFLRTLGVQEHPEKLFEYSKNLLENKNYDKTIFNLELLNSITPNYSTINFSLGLAYFHYSSEKKNDENEMLSLLMKGIEYYENSLVLNDEDKRLTEKQISQANFAIGSFKLQQKKFKDAESYLINALKHDNKNIEIYKLLLIVYKIDKTVKAKIESSYKQKIDKIKKEIYDPLPEIQQHRIALRVSMGASLSGHDALVAQGPSAVNRYAIDYAIKGLTHEFNLEYDLIHFILFGNV